MRKRKKILYIGNSDQYRKAINVILGSTYDILFCENGDCGIEKLHENYVYVDLILYDVRGITKDVKTFLQKKVEAKIYVTIPVIITTIPDDNFNKLEMMKLGVNDIIEYPIDAEVFKLRVDSTMLILDEIRLESRVEVDPTTGIYDKKTLFNQIKHMFDYRNNEYDLLYINVKNLSVYNRSHGFNDGDKMLHDIASAIISFTDSTDRVCGRVDKDVFVLCIKRLDVDGYKELRQKIIDKLYFRYFKEGVVDIVLGVYIIDDYEININDMITHSKVASKKAIDNQTAIEYYCPTLIEEQSRDEFIISKMYDAYTNNEFVVHYQPKMSVKTKKIVSTEALIRWKQKDNTLVSPGDFIPIFEKTGFICNIDMFVLETVCKQQRYNIDNNFKIYPCSVNLSRVSISRRDIIGSISSIVDKYDIPHKYLHFEITETAYLKDTNILLGRTRELVALGYEIELDDFGSGFSSIELLDEMAITNIKFGSRYFLKHFKTMVSPENNALSYSIDLAKRLGFGTIAEGAETKEHFAYLKERGCDFVQGFYFCRPLPIEEFTEFVLNYEPDLSL